MGESQDLNSRKGTHRKVEGSPKAGKITPPVARAGQVVARLISVFHSRPSLGNLLEVLVAVWRGGPRLNDEEFESQSRGREGHCQVEKNS